MPSDRTAISSSKVDTVLMLLLNMTEGPAEAYGTLVAAIYKLNFEFLEHPASIDSLIVEVSQSIRSIKEIRSQH